MTLKKSSPLFKLVQAAVLEVLKSDAILNVRIPELRDSTFKTPRGNVTLMKKLIAQGKKDEEINGIFLKRFADSGRDVAYVIRFTDVCRQVVQAS